MKEKSTFHKIPLSDSGISIKDLLEWGKLGILLNFEDIFKGKLLSLRDIIELCIYTATWRITGKNGEVLKRVHGSLAVAKLHGEVDGIKFEYKAIDFWKATFDIEDLLLSGIEVYCYVSNLHQVSFYTQSEYAIKILSDSQRSMGHYGIWINLRSLLKQISKIKIAKKVTNDKRLVWLRKSYKFIFGRFQWANKFINPRSEKMTEILKEPNTVTTITTNNTGKITSVDQMKKK